MNLFLKNSTKFVVVYCSLAFMTSCLSTNQEIVARSAQSRPEWTSEKLIDPPNTSGPIHVSYKKSKLYRLDLGIRQTQVAASADSKNLLFNRIKQEIFAQSATIEGINISNLENIINNAVKEVQNNYLSSEITPVSVYHEELSELVNGENKKYFDIYVLLSISREQFGEALKNVASKMLELSTEENIQTIAKYVLKNLE